MTRAIIFDCFGVLTQDNWKEFWTALPTTKLRSTVRELSKNHDNGLMTLEEFTKQLVQLTNKPMAEVSAIFRDTGPIKNRQLIDYIKELKLNYKIGIISNIGTSWIEDQLLSADEQLAGNDRTVLGPYARDPRAEERDVARDPQGTRSGRRGDCLDHVRGRRPAPGARAGPARARRAGRRTAVGSAA